MSISCSQFNKRGKLFICTVDKDFLSSFGFSVFSKTAVNLSMGSVLVGGVWLVCGVVWCVVGWWCVVGVWCVVGGWCVVWWCGVVWCVVVLVPPCIPLLFPAPSILLAVLTVLL